MVKLCTPCGIIDMPSDGSPVRTGPRSKRRGNLVRYTTGGGKHTIAFTRVPVTLVGGTLERMLRRQKDVLWKEDDAKRDGAWLFKGPTSHSHALADILNTAPTAKGGRARLREELLMGMGRGRMETRHERLLSMLTDGLWLLRREYET